MFKSPYTWFRFKAVIIKEIFQMKEDIVTFILLIVVPFIQVILFGLIVNTDPKHLPTVIVNADQSPLVRTFIQGLEKTDYFKIIATVDSEQKAQELLDKDKVQFILYIPSDFSSELIRGQRPSLLLEADASDPLAVSRPTAAARTMSASIYDRIFEGAEGNSTTLGSEHVNLIIHSKYNPEAIVQYHSVPGLIVIVLSVTMVMITAISITRERERGTMENLLTTPLRPGEVVLGKILPYIVIGYIQFTFTFCIALFFFHVPFFGNLLLLYISVLFFIIASLAVGLTISSLARTQFQAVQFASFYFLPSMLFSGFMFPYRGMPAWGQWIGSLLPVTHFLRIIRNIMLKGSNLPMIWHDLWPILVFAVIITSIGIKFYRQTLD